MVGGSAGAVGVFLGCELQSMCLEFLAGSSEVVGGGFEGSNGRAFSNGWGVGLKLVRDRGDKGRVECACLRGFVGCSVASFVVNGFGDSV